jgi:hypothetical protein
VRALVLIGDIAPGEVVPESTTVEIGGVERDFDWLVATGHVVEAMPPKPKPILTAGDRYRAARRRARRAADAEAAKEAAEANG